MAGVNRVPIPLSPPQRSGGVRTSLLLGVLYLIALTTVTIVAQLISVVDQGDATTEQRQPASSVPLPSAPPPAPPWSLAPALRPSEPVLWIRVRGNGKFLSASAVTGRVRPTAQSPTTDATHFHRVPVRSSIDGRLAWALRSVGTRRMVVLRTVARGALPVLTLVNESDPEERGGFAVLELPSVHNTSTPLRFLRALGPAGDGRSSGCLHYPLDQPPPGLHLELQSGCTGSGNDASASTDANASIVANASNASNVSAGWRVSPWDPRAYAFEVGRADTASTTPAWAHVAPDTAPVRIALGVAVRTLVATPPLELPLIRVFVPSLVATVGSRYGTGRYRYEFTLYLGYDADDPTYDDPLLLAGVSVALRRLLRNSPVSVVAVKYGGEDKGAPCWVWNKLFARACDEGCSYFYQLNDDLQLLTPGWAPRFVSALNASMPPNFGIAGPLDLNNERLMTQSFASCTHLEVFGFYYPWRFRNWFSDDWAAQVYGPERTFWMQDVEVDHSLTKGPRYVISYEHGKVVQPLLTSARKRLCSWLRNASRAANRSGVDDLTAKYSACPAVPPSPPSPPPSTTKDVVPSHRQRRRQRRQQRRLSLAKSNSTGPNATAPAATALGVPMRWRSSTASNSSSIPTKATVNRTARFEEIVLALRSAAAMNPMGRV